MLKLALFVAAVCLVHSSPIEHYGEEKDDKRGGDMGGMGGWGGGMGGDMGGMYGGGGMHMDKEMIEKKMKELVKHFLHAAHEMKEKHEIYRFGLFDAGKPNSFLDSESGHPMGFYPDILHTICKVAEKHCIIKWITKAQAFDMTNNISPALNEGYVDAIMGVQALNAPFFLQYGIAAQFAEPNMYKMYVKTASTRTKMDEYNQAADSITYVGALANPVSCYGLWEKKKNPTAANLITEVTTQTEMTNTMGSTNANLNSVWILDDATVTAWSLTTSLKAISEDFSCAHSGKGSMIRKEDKHRFDWWYPAGMEVMKSGVYKWLCTIAPKAYGGGTVNCADPEKTMAKLKMYLMGEKKDEKKDD